MSNESKKVKSRTVLHAEYKVQISKTTEPVKNMMKERIELFDEDGNIVEEIQFDREGNEFEKIKRTFQNGKIVRLEKFYGEEDPDEIKLYEYDAQGNLLTEKLQLSDGSAIETRNTFFNSCAVKSLIIDEEDGNSEIIREFDTSGNAIKIIHQHSEGEVIEKHEFRRDERGNIIHESYINFETGEEHNIRREFDASDRLTLEIRETDDQIAEESRYEYGTHGIIAFVRNNGDSIEAGTYDYDDKGRIVSRTLREKMDVEDEGIMMLEMEEVYDNNMLKSTHVNQFNPAMQIMVPYDYFYEYEFF